MAGNTLAGFAYTVLASFMAVAVYATYKKVNPGDGVFFCMCMSLGIVLVGFLVNFTLADEHYSNFSFHNGPDFEPYTMWGGVAWQLGNLLCPIVVRLLGVGVGVGIWDTADLLTGWAASKFGLFGVIRQDIVAPLVNYMGVALACVSVLLMVLVDQEGQPEPGSAPSPNPSSAAAGLEPQQDCKDDAAGPAPGGDHDVEAQVTPETPTTAASAGAGAASPKLGGSASLLWYRRHGAKAGGIVLAMLTGFLQGLKLDSSVYLMELGKLGQGHSTNAMDYVFPLFSSIFITGAVVFAVYLAKNGRDSYLPRELVLPGVVGGALWGFCIVLMFQANEELSLVIWYPLASTLIGILTTGMAFYYGEFQTRRNCVLAAVGTLLRIIAVTFIALSDNEALM